MMASRSIPTIWQMGLTSMALQANMTGVRAVGGIGGFGDFNQTINVNQQISTPDELARAVRVESRYGLMKGVAFG